jgi:hypothetical protein
MRHRQAVAVARPRQVPVAGFARTVRLCGDRGAAPIAGCSGVVGRFPTRAVAARDHDRVRLACTPPSPVAYASSSLRPSRPSVGPCANGRGLEPPQVNQVGTGHRGNARRKSGTGPAVKTSNPRLPPRDADRAVGGIRAWAENPGRRASYLVTLLPSRAFTCTGPNSLLGLGHGFGHRADSPPAAGIVSREIPARSC